MKRLSFFVALGLLGVVALLAGLSWDALLHARDPALAAEEGLFTFANPGHVLLALGIAGVVVGLLGVGYELLRQQASGLWSQPLVRRGFLAAGTALVVGAVSVTSWASAVGQRAHQHDAAHTGHNDETSLIAARSSAHGHGLVADTGSAAASDPAHAHSAAHGGSVASGHHEHLAGAADSSGVEVEQHPADSHDHVHLAGSLVSADPAAAQGAGTGDVAPSADSPERPLGMPTTVRYGPLLLAPAGLEPAHAEFLLTQAPKPCVNCFLTSLRPDLVYADGSPANLDTGVMLHHANWIQAGASDVVCPGDSVWGRMGQRFFGAGNERTEGAFPAGFGYFVGEGAWTVPLALMNHSPEPRSVYLTLSVSYVPAAGADLKPTTPIWINVGDCGNSEYDVPAGPSHAERLWTSTVTGRFIGAGGHVHDGGVKTVLTNETTGREICTSLAGYGTKPAYRGSIESMSMCRGDTIGTVRAGEVLAVRAYYDAPAPISEAMGIMLGYLYETTDLTGGGPPPSSQAPARRQSDAPGPHRHRP